MTFGTASFPMLNLSSMSCVPDAPIRPSLPGRAFTTSLTTSPPIHFIPPANSAYLSTVPTTASLGISTGTALTTLFDPALTHYRCHRVYIVFTRSERITLTHAHFPLPYFHFAESDLPPPLPISTTSARSSPTLDGTDLIGRVFNDPDLGLCSVTEVGPRLRLAPGEGNLNPTGPHLQAGWVPTLRYTSLGGATHTSSVTEVAEWVQP
jgi:hypothetical protein